MLNKTIGFALVSLLLVTACDSGQVRTESEPPSVVSFEPADGASNVALDKRIQVTFSEKIPAATVRRDRFEVKFADNDSMEQGSYEVEGSTAYFIPQDSLLDSNVTYEVTVDSVADMHGNKMVGQTKWTFSTVDVPPAVESVEPAEGASDVALDSDITVTFTEPVDGATVDSESFRVVFAANDSLESGDITTNGATATFSPTDSLDNDATYQVTVSDVADLEGNVMQQAKTWEFATTDTTGSGQ